MTLQGSIGSVLVHHMLVLPQAEPSHAIRAVVLSTCVLLTEETTHLFRTIYGRLAVYYYCPPTVNDLTYLGTIYGHYWELENDQQKHDYAATLHYFDYKIGDGAGNVDGRQGIRLGEREVRVLEVFQKQLNQKPEKPVKLLPTTQTNKTGYSSVRPKSETKVMLVKISEETGVKDNDELLRLLIAEYYEVVQLRERVDRPAPRNPLAGVPELEVLLVKEVISHLTTAFTTFALHIAHRIIILSLTDLQYLHCMKQDTMENSVGGHAGQKAQLHSWSPSGQAKAGR